MPEIKPTNAPVEFARLQPIEVIERTLDRDYFMSSEEAKAFGLIDHVYERREGDLTTPAPDEAKKD